MTAAIRAVRERAEQASVYLYGSVATGQARIGKSDVDLLSIGLAPGDGSKFSEQLSEQFACVCRAVEIGSAERVHYVGQSDEAYGNRVFPRHYCVCLTGGYPVALDAAYRADVRAARGFNGDIGQHAERWREALKTVEDKAALGRRMARKTLFAVTGLVSVHDDLDDGPQRRRPPLGGHRSGFRERVGSVVALEREPRHARRIGHDSGARRHRGRRCYGICRHDRALEAR